MPEEHQPESGQPEPRKRSNNRRRGRRGGRGRGRRQPSVHAAAPESAPDEPATSTSQENLTEAPSVEQAPPERPVHAPRPERPPAYKPRQEQNLSPVAKAANEVRHIVESLEQALEQMEEVLELVELAEHQKHDDEREIESLRRALRRIQLPRGEERREEHR